MRWVAPPAQSAPISTECADRDVTPPQLQLGGGTIGTIGAANAWRPAPSPARLPAPALAQSPAPNYARCAACLLIVEVRDMRKGAAISPAREQGGMQFGRPLRLALRQQTRNFVISCHVQIRGKWCGCAGARGERQRLHVAAGRARAPRCEVHRPADPG